MKGNRKENVREVKKELLNLFVKSSGQRFEEKKGMGEDGRVGQRKDGEERGMKGR